MVDSMPPRFQPEVMLSEESAKGLIVVKAKLGLMNLQHRTAPATVQSDFVSM